MSNEGEAESYKTWTDSSSYGGEITTLTYKLLLCFGGELLTLLFAPDCSFFERVSHLHLLSIDSEATRYDLRSLLYSS